MITDDDIKKLSKVFATKEDLESFATKDDLRGFATKDDLHDLEDKLMTLVDAVYQEVVAMRQEQSMHFQSHREIDDRLNKLEGTVFKTS